jgi:hypothetical protein
MSEPQDAVPEGFTPVRGGPLSRLRRRRAELVSPLDYGEAVELLWGREPQDAVSHNGVPFDGTRTFLQLMAVERACRCHACKEALREYIRTPRRPQVAEPQDDPNWKPREEA